MFINRENRTVDGGASCATIRNDNGPIRLGHPGYNTKLDGNVGIGTNPSASLHVQGDASIFGNNGGGSGIVINDIPQARWRISTGGYALRFSKHNSTSDEYSTWSEKVRIDENGNVVAGNNGPHNLGRLRFISGSVGVGSSTVDHVTSIPVVGSHGGGTVVLYISLNWNAGTSTGSAVIHFRMLYNGTWSDSSTTKNVISDLNMTSEGKMPTFSDDGNGYLKITSNQGGNWQYSAHYDP